MAGQQEAEGGAVALMQWGDAWEQGPAGPPRLLVHDTCGHVTQPVLTCPHCQGEVTARNTRSEPAPRLKAV